MGDIKHCLAPLRAPHHGGGGDELGDGSLDQLLAEGFLPPLGLFEVLLHRGEDLDDVLALGVEERRHLVDGGIDLLDVAHGRVAGDEDQPLHPVLDPFRPHDLDEPDLSSGVGVRPPARLHVPVGDVDDPERPRRDDAPLEQPEAVLRLGLLAREAGDFDREVLHHHVVRGVFDPPHVPVGQLGEVRDVQPPVVLLLERRVLPHPWAQHVP